MVIEKNKFLLLLTTHILVGFFFLFPSESAMGDEQYYGDLLDSDVKGEVVVVFTNNGTLNLSANAEVEYLVIGGGGGGGGNYGGGGGGGSFRTGTLNALAGDYSVIVGVGGAGGTKSSRGNNGGASSIFGITSVGGGGGGTGGERTVENMNLALGRNGGSGGGGGGVYSSSYHTFRNGGNGVSGQGSRGGWGYGRLEQQHGTGTWHNLSVGGGGGGAGGYSTSFGNEYSEPGLGGNGIEVNAWRHKEIGSISGQGGYGRISSISGTTVWYAGGGAGNKHSTGWFSVYGGGHVNTRPSGKNDNAGGGGAHCGWPAYIPPSGCFPLTGTNGKGGGGSGGNKNSNGYRGGSGIVIVKYRYTDHTVNYVSSPEKGGTIVPSSRTVQPGGVSAAPVVNPNSGYYPNEFTKPSGSCGNLNSKTGRVDNVTCDLEITKHWLLCPKAKCSDIDHSKEWYDTCPQGQNCIEEEHIIPIDSPHSNCNNSEVKLCFTVNAPPTVSMQIKTGDDVEGQGQYNGQISGFSSVTHTGKELNNPRTQLIATYTDSDGYNDIKRMYVWWKESSPTPPLLKEIDNNKDKLALSNSFGFMIARDGNNNWKNVYVPHLNGGTRRWVKAGEYGDGSIVIKGPGNKDMVNLTNMHISESDNNVVIKVLFNFDKEVVKTSNYYLWAMADDYFPEETSWHNVGINWILDMIDPTVSPVTVLGKEGTLVDVSFSINDANDGLGLSYVRLDACRAGGDSIKVRDNLKSDKNNKYDLNDCQLNGIYGSGWHISQPLSLLGNTGKLPSGTSSKNIVVEVDLGKNSGGEIIFRAVVMDNGGNFMISHPEVYKLGDWVITRDGLVFGSRGVNAPTRDLDNVNYWEDTILNSYNFNSATSDLTIQALLKRPLNVINSLGDLVNYSDNKSFKIARFPGFDLKVHNVYDDLIFANEAMKEKGYLKSRYQKVNFSGNPSSLSQLCTGSEEYCIVVASGDINIQQGFVCDGKGLIIVDGNIVINPNITNSKVTDACIILAKQDINITKGEKITSVSGPGYNLVRAFMIAGGTINIEENGNGLLVEGGLVACTPIEESGSVFNSRSIDISLRNLFPVLAVDNNSKYGLLAKRLFGSQVDMFKFDIGFKPF